MTLLRSALRRHRLWATAAVSTGLIAVGSVGLARVPGASADVAPGVGSSYAQGFQVTPHEGSLAVGAVFDEALAGHTDKIARAQSQGLDLGAVGASIKGYNCGQPPTPLAAFVPDPLQAETPSNGGSQELTQGPSPTDNNSDGSVEHVVANSGPYGQAETTLAGPVAAPGNLVSVSGVASKAWSGLVNGVREAGATVDIGSVTVAGVVSLSGLHWEAIYPTGGSGQPSTDFEIAKATVAGNAVPTSNLSALGDAVDKALSNLGLSFQLPKPSSAQGIQFLSPLQIAVVPNTARDSTVDPVMSTYVQPQYFQLANGLENGFATSQTPYSALAPTESGSQGQQLQAALCQSDTPITVLDITIASLTGGGYFNVALGGVNATSGELPVNPYDLSFTAGDLSVAGTSQFIPGSDPTPGTPGGSGTGASLASTTPVGSGTPGLPAVTAGGDPRPTTGGRIDTSPAALVSAESPGSLLAVGLGVLGLLVLLAEADRRMIGRSAHGAKFEE